MAAAESGKRVVLCLGSNVEPRMGYLDRAQAALCAFPETCFVAASSTRETEPVDVPPEFADMKFLNRVVVLDTALTPQAFAERMFALEDALGRVRGSRRNEPRTIDVDMIAYEGVASDDSSLTLPHPRASARSFVMEPMRELGLEFMIYYPAKGKE